MKYLNNSTFRFENQTFPNFSRSQDFGYIGEKMAAEILSDLGWSIYTPADFCAPYDLKIGKPGGSIALHVEVKIANPTYRKVRPDYYRPRYQFDLRGGLDPAKIDFLYILICQDEKGNTTPLVVPSWALGHRNQVQITSDPEKYSGQLLAEYRDNWQGVEAAYNVAQKYEARRAGQMSIFH